MEVPYTDDPHDDEQLSLTILRRWLHAETTEKQPQKSSTPSSASSQQKRRGNNNRYSYNSGVWNEIETMRIASTVRSDDVDNEFLYQDEQELSSYHEPVVVVDTKPKKRQQQHPNIHEFVPSYYSASPASSSDSKDGAHGMVQLTQDGLVMRHDVPRYHHSKSKKKTTRALQHATSRNHINDNNSSTESISSSSNNNNKSWLMFPQDPVWDLQKIKNAWRGGGQQHTSSPQSSSPDQLKPIPFQLPPTKTWQTEESDESNNDVEQQQRKMATSPRRRRRLRRWIVPNCFSTNIWILSACLGGLILFAGIIGVPILFRRQEKNSKSTSLSNTDPFDTNDNNDNIPQEEQQDDEEPWWEPEVVPTDAPTVAPVATLRPTFPAKASTTARTTSSPTPAPTTLTPDDDRPYTVVVIGAGWSGLATMRTLWDAGYRHIHLLEARDTLGGRSQTLRKGKNVVLELGSEFWYPNTPLYQEWVVPTRDSSVLTTLSNVQWYQETTMVQPDASKSSQLSQQQQDILVETVWVRGFVPFVEKRVRDLRKSKQDETFADVLDEYSEDLSESEEQFLRTVINFQLSVEFAGDLQNLSVTRAAYMLTSFPTLEHASSNNHDSVLQRLTQPFLDHITYNARVINIDYTPDDDDDARSIVTYVDGTGSVQTVQASMAVVTVPLGVLQASRITFAPPLPATKRRAIQEIGYGTLNKCILYWKQDKLDWWPDEVWMGLVTSHEETSGLWTLFFNHKAVESNNNILTAWIGGDDATWMERQSDEEIVGQVLYNLRTMKGFGAVPKPTSYVITKWGSDQFSLGSYSYPKFMDQDKKNDDPVPTDRELRQALQEPVGSLFFAGEATEPEWYATTAGAYDSGVKVAKQILKKATWCKEKNVFGHTVC